MTNILFNSLAANLQYDLTKLIHNYRLLLALHEISRLGTVEATTLDNLHCLRLLQQLHPAPCEAISVVPALCATGVG